MLRLCETNQLAPCTHGKDYLLQLCQSNDIIPCTYSRVSHAIEDSELFSEERSPEKFITKDSLEKFCEANQLKECSYKKPPFSWKKAFK